MNVISLFRMHVIHHLHKKLLKRPAHVYISQLCIIQYTLQNQPFKEVTLKMAPKKRALSEKTSETPSAKNIKVQNIDDFLNDIQSKRLSCCSSVADFKFNKKRVKVLSESEDISDNAKAIVYWMSRDQRVQDNWSLLYAQRLALKTELPLIVCFCLVPKFLDATIRHFGFMLKGLKEVSQECEELSIHFVLLLGPAKTVLPPFVKEHKIGAVVADFSPLRVPLGWITDVGSALPSSVPFCQVDSHNIVPCWVASDKLEYGARTIRRKIMDKLSEYCTEFPPVIKHPYKFPSETKLPKVDWDAAFASLEVDETVKEVEWAGPGTRAGLQVLNQFCQERLRSFADSRNDPTQDALSNLSPWFHFGQISVQRCILTVRELRKSFPKSVEAFVEEAVVRRELADNFCFYNKNYDSLEGAWDWARTTLNIHRKDKRDYVYTRDQLQDSKTHDLLWNAAQKQMVVEGKMHGFLRMYWAKKILEWTSSPEEALEIAVYLNDKYELDGRDPNGYVGCMWSICGVHDQGWAERPVFGKIRFMNYKGCTRKFDVDAFIRKYR